MKPIQHGSRANHGTAMGKELYRTQDETGPIIVTQRGNRRLMNFGSVLEQSCVLMPKPHYLIHEYTRIMLLGLLFADSDHITLLGLGGGGLVHCLGHFYPASSLRVVELRQQVIEVAHEWFALPRGENMEIINDDAGNYMNIAGSGSADIIFSDLYLAGGMSGCQAQQAFIRSCADVLTADGCLVLNFHEKPFAGSAIMHEIDQLFRDVIVYESEAGDTRQNAILFCCKARVELHQPELNWQADRLSRQVKMPLMQYYRKLKKHASAPSLQTEAD